ncbi:hypothetical protein TrST_g5886 [Triparma strigata]|uniref:Tyrosine-protein kinase ephrin type A/B receptor-like domain-containing protein n=1 Tax=Triparma strigata TaxID=1606541 RepID=A0A9W6ZXU5_9STRA|nr:hypothetical protein TrST_g5886 [Triparma strigata]
MDFCGICEAGKFSGEGSNSCSSCPAGKHINSGATGDESSVCSNCASGKYSGTASATCSICAAGTYASSKSSSECTICPAGKYNPDQATDAAYHTSCSACSPGTKLEDDGTDAEKHNAADDCELCGPGYFSNETGSASCSAAAPALVERCHLLEQLPAVVARQVTSAPEERLLSAPQESTARAEAAAGPAKKAIAVQEEQTEVPASSGNYTTPATAEDVTTRTSETICELGFACVGGVKTSCDGPGQYSDETGLAACKTAPAGKKPTYNRQDIENCSPGRYSVGGKIECDECDTGKFSTEGAVGCSLCEPGEIPVSNVCTKCEKGKYATFGSSTCLSCDGPGEYSDEGAGYCQTCPQYEVFSNQTNACECIHTFTRVDDGTCTCKAGETLMGTTCEPCEKAKWKAEDGVTSCSLCSSTLEDSITKDFGSTSAIDCKCPKGTYDDGKGKCKVIKDGMDDTAVGMCLKNVTIDPGFWRVNSDSTDVRECHVSEACTGGNSTNYCQTLKAASILNIDVFNMVSVGCWAASINYYEKALLTTLTIIAVCGVLILAGLLVKKYMSSCFTSAIAIMYLVLPTVTTKIFGLFPCDELDDGSEMLRKDYTISCQDDGRDFWETYGWLMVGVFPVGVISMYGFLLWSKRAKLKKPVEQRLEDEEITPLLFLWEPYKPEFWYWEAIETGRRLMMTGVLSTIKPGSYS